MHTKTLYIAILAMLPAGALAGFAPLIEFLLLIHADFIIDRAILLSIYTLVAIYVIGNIFHIAQYTDEFLPFQISLLNFVLIGIGLWTYSQFIIAGAGVLIFAAYWCNESVNQYFPLSKQND